VYRGGSSWADDILSQKKKRGTNYLGNCPFHNEKSPSFTVSPAKEIYKCFGCGKSGNSISFLMEHEKYSYVEALRWLATLPLLIQPWVPAP
jgi:DNA primase